MYDTTIMLKPLGQWRKGMTYDQLIAEMDGRLHFPGLSNSWTMPVENRLDMELTGIKTPVGLKIQGPDVDRIQHIGSQIEEILGSVPGTGGIFAERVSQGFYIDVDVERTTAARYGLTVGDVQRAVSSGMGGENIATTVEGRERYPISVRYLADYRNDLNSLRRILIMTPTGAQIPLGEVARIGLSPGPSMIRDEDGFLTGYVYIDLATSDYGTYVNKAQRALDRHLRLPAGYNLKWSGEYEFQLRARKRLRAILPIVFGLIFVLLYMLFRSATEAMVLILPAVYAMTGGLLLQYMMGFNFSVAVWVGYIALFGIAVETGVVMVIYLHEALNRHIAAGELTNDEIELAVIEGAVQRLRPKLMTVAVVMLSLAPILWESGIGSDVMKPIAAPIVGGMITSTIHVLILVPVFFAIMKERTFKKNTLR
jgi:Cu(I)/Ag(I) efflux system membrane protein CusA/SilA